MMQNVGPAVRGLVDVRGEPGPEMSAFDQLGPRVRKVINDGLCVNWSAEQTLHAMRQTRQNPKDARVDALWAKRLSDLNGDIAATLRADDERMLAQCQCQRCTVKLRYSPPSQRTVNSGTHSSPRSVALR